jgi:hypothetical protein
LDDPDAREQNRAIPRFGVLSPAETADEVQMSLSMALLLTVNAALGWVAEA